MFIAKKYTKENKFDTLIKVIEQANDFRSVKTFVALAISPVDTIEIVTNENDERISIFDENGTCLLVIQNLEKSLVRWGNYMASKERLKNLIHEHLERETTDADVDKFYHV